MITTVTVRDVTFRRERRGDLADVSAYHLGNRVGWITADLTGRVQPLGPHGEPVIADLFVDRAFRRKGVATELLRVLRQTVPNVSHSPERSIAGQLWALSTGDSLPQWVPIPWE